MLQSGIAKEIADCVGTKPLASFSGTLTLDESGFPRLLASPVRETVQTSGPVFGPTRGVPQRPTAGMMSLLPTETPGSCRRVPPVFRDSLSHWTTSWPQGTPCLECSVISFRGSPSTLSGSDDRRDNLLTPRHRPANGSGCDSRSLEWNPS